MLNIFAHAQFLPIFLWVCLVFEIFFELAQHKLNSFFKIILGFFKMIGTEHTHTIFLYAEHTLTILYACWVCEYASMPKNKQRKVF